MGDFRQKLSQFKDFMIQKIWPDPVWSKVIAGLILVFISSISAVVFVFAKSIFTNVSINMVAHL